MLLPVAFFCVRPAVKESAATSFGWPVCCSDWFVPLLLPRERADLPGNPPVSLASQQEVSLSLPALLKVLQECELVGQKRLELLHW
jgi:hypothetical protein